MGAKLNRIKVVLVEKNVSQKELAAQIGKSFSTVNGSYGNDSLIKTALFANGTLNRSPTFHAR